MKGDMDGLLHHLNSIRPIIKFTVEVEEGRSLPFHDTKVTRKEDGKLDITVVYTVKGCTRTGTCTLGLIIQQTGVYTDFQIRKSIVQRH